MPKAPRICPTAGCTNLIRHTPYCPDHTVAWSGPQTASSKAAATYAWKQLADTVKRRDRHQCQLRYPNICTGHATAVDHIIPVAKRPDLRLDPNNCQAACRKCNEHKARTLDRS